MFQVKNKLTEQSGHDGTIYEPRDYEVFFQALEKTPRVRNAKREITSETYEIAASFDIETSSFRIEGKKAACMYVWQMGISEFVMIGRTWRDFVFVIMELNKYLDSKRCNLIIWVHNLPYEFQFLRHWLKFDKVFAGSTREPIYANCGRISFRCSYKESGFSLDYIGREKIKDKRFKKMAGDLDYRLIRHSETPLTDEELGYCMGDVLTLNQYIKEKSEAMGGIMNIALTSTGYVRREIRAAVFADKYWKTRIQKITMVPEEYELMRWAFQGGFTHADPLNCDIIFGGKDNPLKVSSSDISSSYPTVMLTEFYPMSKGVWTCIDSREKFDEIRKSSHLLFEIRFTKLRPRVNFEFPISESKSIITGTREIWNGRVIEAEELITAGCEIDFEIWEKFYEWDTMQIGKAYRYHLSEYLPTPIIKTMLEYYRKKTEYKGLDEYETEYNFAKGNLNASFGMMVMNPIREQIEFSGGYWANELEEPDSCSWIKEEEEPFITPEEDRAELIKGISKYNKDRNRFLCYVWGVYITAYARRNLFLSIYEAKEDHIYCDTDSDKIVNYEKHEHFYKWYNEQIKEKCDAACLYHGLPLEASRPKSPDGKERQLGIWDFEGTYELFKTLGAKRYLYTKRNNKTGKYELHSTVAGVSKRGLPLYLAPDKIEIIKDDNGNIIEELAIVEPDDERPFEKFNSSLVVPPEYSGRLISTYLDNPEKSPLSGIVTDYLGSPGEFFEQSALNLEPSDYKFDNLARVVEWLNMYRQDYGHY